MEEPPVEVTVLGDVARDVNVRIGGALPDDLTIAGDTPAQIRIVPGGSAATTAAWLASVGSAVTLIGARGDDDAGRDAERDLARWGVRALLEVVASQPTGTIVVLVDHRGERSMLPDAGANAALTAAWCVEHLAGSHLHVSAYAWFRPSTRPGVEAAIRAARERSMTVSLDLNSHGLVQEHRADLMELLPVDVVFGNALEFTALAPASAPRDAIFVEKRGAAGARWVRGPMEHVVPAQSVAIADTVGAGDAFAAGFLSTWLAGGDPEASVGAGNALAALCVSRVGPWPALPA